MPVTDLKKHLVDDFPLSQRRSMLWNNLMEIVTKLESLKIRCEVWVDGSFLTEKIDPNDIDLVIAVHTTTVDSINASQDQFLSALVAQDFYSNKKLDTYVIVKAPAGHTMFPVSQIAQQQWLKDFGHAFVSGEPKGIAVIEVAP